MSIRVYFAGPLFTTYERAFIDECAAKLRKEDYEVFVPHEAFNFTTLTDQQRQAQAELDSKTKSLNIFSVDYQALCWANVMVVIVDGTQVDDGTATEIGIFCEQKLAGKDKRAILALSSDMRVGPNALAGELKQLNFFTAGAIYKCGDIYTTIEDILEELRQLEQRQ